MGAIAMTASTPQQTIESPQAQFLRLPIILALLLLPLCFLGYGSDNDTYGVVSSGYSTWHLHILSTSRNPGYWTFEAIVYGLSRVGGYLAANLATLVVGTLCLWRFMVLASRVRVRFPELLTLCLAATPVFAIACTSTDDYLWSLLGIVLCAELLIADRLALAILPGAFAFAVRGANGLVIAGVIVGAMVAQWMTDRRFTPRILQLAGVGAAAALIGSPPYLLSYHLAGNSIHFADGMIGSAGMWTFKMRLGRFLYKGVFLFGPLACLLLAASVAVRRRWPVPSDSEVVQYRARAFPIFAGVVVFNLILYYRFPIEISYLIPAGFFALLLLGTTVLAKSRALTVAFLISIASLNLVMPQFARPNIPGQATDASLHFSLSKGGMVGDVQQRLALRQCTGYDYNCFVRNALR